MKKILSFVCTVAVAATCAATAFAVDENATPGQIVNDNAKQILSEVGQGSSLSEAQYQRVVNEVLKPILDNDSDSEHVHVTREAALLGSKAVEKAAQYDASLSVQDFTLDLNAPAVQAEPAQQAAAETQPVVVEEPAASEEAAPAEEPAASEETAPAEEPAASEEAAPAEEPAASEEAAPAEEPAASEEAAPAEEPAASEEAAPAEEPAASEEAAPAEEPAASEEAAPAEEPAASEETAPAEEPVTSEQAAPAEEPAASEETAPAEEPVASEQTAPAEEPVASEDTAPAEETIPAEEAAIAVQADDNVQQPVVVGKLGTVELKTASKTLIDAANVTGSVNNTSKNIYEVTVNMPVSHEDTPAGYLITVGGLQYWDYQMVYGTDTENSARLDNLVSVTQNADKTYNITFWVPHFSTYTICPRQVIENNDSNNSSSSSGSSSSYEAPDDSIYYTCPKCGYHNWTGTEGGYRCDHCGYLEEVKELAGWPNVNGVATKTAAQTAALYAGAIKATGASMSLMALAVVTMAAAAVGGAAYLIRKNGLGE